MDSVYAIVSALVGFPALLSAGINIAKKFGLIGDGDAPAVVFWGNLAAFVLVAVAVFFGKSDLIPQIDNSLSSVAQVLVLIASFVTSLGLTKAFHVGLRGLPLIGFSHSIEERKAY